MRSLLLIVCVAVFWNGLPSTQARTIDETILNALTASQELGVPQQQDNDTVVVEMDMVYRKEDYEDMQLLRKESSAAGSDLKKERRKKRKALRDTRYRWSNNQVFYYLTPNTFSSSDQVQIQNSINEWQQYTCLTFTQRTSQRNYVNFVNGGGCSSYVGEIGGAQALTLAPGCRVKSVIVHEIGHAIGFHHEQTRPDRNSYVTINYGNIQSGVEFNFEQYTTSYINDHSVPYDYRSVMHYGQNAFSRNGQPTILTTDPSYQNIIGRAGGLSFRDVKLANLMYDCASQCGGVTCPGEGFVGKDCQCYCEGSPVQLCSGGPIGSTNNPPTYVPPTNGPPGGCVDENANCAYWASQGECLANPNYMLQYCKKSCEVCDEDCQDVDGNCAQWASQGECENNPLFMLIFCPRSCGVC